MRSTTCLRFACLPLILVALLPALTLVATGQSNERANIVHVLSAEFPDRGIFPSDFFTVSDHSQSTQLRINLPLPDCTVHPSDCNDIALINQLDGFNLQSRVTVPFDGAIDPSSVNSKDVFFVELGDPSDLSKDWRLHHRHPKIIGINQSVWDEPTKVLAVEADEQLEQHTRYAFVVTTGVRDASGASVAPGGMLLRPSSGAATADNANVSMMQREVWEAFGAVHDLGISAEQIAGLSVFTTQSATAVLEHIRDDLKKATPEPVSFMLGPGGTRTVFPVSSIDSIDWQVHLGGNPPVFQPFKTAFYSYLPVAPAKYFTLLDLYSPEAVEKIAYGSYRSPRYVANEPVMPAVGTRAGRPPVQSIETMYVNFFLPAGPQPEAGWPVVIFGLGGGDYKDEEVYLYAAAFAAHGMATACINVNGQGYGPLSYLTVTLKDGASVRFPSGGRSTDVDGDGVIKDNEGVQTVSSAYRSLGARDTIRQTVIDYLQLAREIQVGVDVDGDGRPDLDPSRITYYGMSFGGGALGPTFMAVESDMRYGALGSAGGLNSRWDILRLRPSARSQVGAVLQSRVPSLLNSPGLTEWGGIPVNPPYFNENIPLRNQPFVTDHVDGAMDIQKYMDNVAWLAASGDGASYVPHIRKEPLLGNSPKSVLFMMQKGDQSAPNPRSTQLARAGGLADVTTFYRNDLAYAEDPTINKNPHSMQLRWTMPGLSGEIARGSIEQTAIFLASGGQTIVHPEPARLFEVPIVPPLPEDFSYIP
jgi:Bacterial Ig-like domain